jgi:hypothetical protein
MSLAGIIVGLILIGVGAVVLFFALQFAVEKYRSDDWIPIEAKILRSGVEKIKDEYETWYKSTIYYEYNLDGNTYTNTDKTEDRNTKKRKVKKKYAEGNPLTVYYNPEKPYESVINPGMDYIRILVMLLIPAILIIAGLNFLGR